MKLMFRKETCSKQALKIILFMSLCKFSYPYYFMLNNSGAPVRRRRASGVPIP